VQKLPQHRFRAVIEAGRGGGAFVR